MLFILNGDGVPSVSRIVQLQGSAPLPPAPGPPDAPTNLVATGIDGQHIRVSWKDNSTSETNFLVEQCLGQSCTDFSEVARIDPQVNVYVAGSLTATTAYTFRVRALNDAGYSAYSNTAGAITTGGETFASRTIVSELAKKCVEAEDGSQLNGVRIVITPCGTASKYQWSVPPRGYEGDIRIFATKCFDAAGGYGIPGDKILLWDCHSGANQRWTLTTAGELKGINGLCVALDGSATLDRTTMSIQQCNGSLAQKWSYGTAGSDLPPVAQFTYSCSTWTCDFNSSASADDQGIASRAWDFGDGTTAGDVVSPHKVYNEGGTYHVTLTVTDIAGQSSSKAQDVIIIIIPSNQAPVAAFTSGCTGLTCTFTDGSTDDGTIATRSWSFGDGGTSTQTSPSHPYAVAGTYAVTLTVTDDKGATGTVSKTVSPTAAASGVGSITSRSSGKCLAVQGASHTNATPVVLATCLNSSEQQWKIPATGTAGAITVYDAATCLDASGAQGNDGDQIIIWPCKGGLGVPGPNQTWTYTAAGAITGINGKCIAIIGSPSANGSTLALATCADVAAQKFDAGTTTTPAPNSPPVAAFTSSCTGLACGFTDGSTDNDGSIASRSWNFGDGGTSTQTSPSHTYTTGGTYTVKLTVTDDKGATGTVSKTVSPTAPASGVGAIASRASGKCLAVQGASHTNATPVVLATCLTSSEQQWKVPPTGTAGPITVYDAVTCLDASGTRGRNGDPIIIWPCKGVRACRVPIKPGSTPQREPSLGSTASALRSSGRPRRTAPLWRSPRAPMLWPRSSTSERASSCGCCSSEWIGSAGSSTDLEHQLPFRIPSSFSAMTMILKRHDVRAAAGFRKGYVSGRPNG